MFGLFMAILFVVVAIGSAIHRSMEVHNNRLRAIEQGKDSYFDQNYNSVHVDDGLPYTYKYINGDCYELNPYSFKIRRNITKERDAAKLRVFRRMAEEKGLRFIEDTTDHTTYERFLKSDVYKYNGSFSHYKINPYVDTVTGKKYLGFSYNTSQKKGEIVPLFGFTVEETKLYPTYLVNPQTGFIEGVNTDLLNENEEYIYKYSDTQIPTKEILNKEIENFNELVWMRYQWKADLERERTERDQLEAEIQKEIRAGRQRGEKYL